GAAWVGGEADETIPASTLLDVTGWCPERPRTRRATRLRLVSVFRHGWVRVLGALARPGALPQGPLVSQPSPAPPRPGAAAGGLAAPGAIARGPLGARALARPATAGG